MEPDDIEVHREGERAYWFTTEPEDFEDFWDSQPSFEKWRKGGKWN